MANHTVNEFSKSQATAKASSFGMLPAILTAIFVLGVTIAAALSI